MLAPVRTSGELSLRPGSLRYVVSRSPDRVTPTTEGLHRPANNLVVLEVGDLRSLAAAGSGDPATTRVLGSSRRTVDLRSLTCLLYLPDASTGTEAMRKP